MLRASHGLAADPTPVVVTLSAVHVHAPLVFLYRYPTIWTLVAPAPVSPAPEQMLLSLRTRFAFVHRKNLALEAESSLTLRTRYFPCLWVRNLDYSILTIRVGTELPGLADKYLSILFEFPILGDNILRYKCGELLFADGLPTPLLWTFEKMRFSSFRNFESKVALKTFQAELMETV